MFLRTKIRCVGVLFFLSFLSAAFSQNALFIPDTLAGTTFTLNVQTGTKSFFSGTLTPTYGYNGNFLGPTLLIKKNDSVTLNVNNNLPVATTVHWHGFHVSAMNDGGPHQSIAAGTSWSPSFKMRNEASTFWYHPHGEAKTEVQITKGLAGMIIVRDSIEATYALPRKYGVDDFPLIIQTKAFIMVNGTMDPYLQVPKQVVRFRLLNASADRTYYFGLSDSSNFQLIASDGGLLSQPYQTNRIRLSTGERVEVLIDFGADTIGHQKYLRSYASELPNGIIGADSVGTSMIVMGDGYYNNPLNGLDFNILRLDVIATTTSPVTTIPSSFAAKTPIPESSSDVTRHLRFFPDTAFNGMMSFVDGPFFINDKLFDMDSINIVTYLNNTEIWSLTNETMIAHPFHIHDVEFYVLDINSIAPPPQYAGLKDVILVKPGDTVRFITKFTDFADDMVPYMYHCHLLHHEDEGMMGTFLVLDTTASLIIDYAADERPTAFPNPFTSAIKMQLDNRLNTTVHYRVFNILGETIMEGESNVVNGKVSEINGSDLSSGFYLIALNNQEKNWPPFKIIKQ